MSLTPSKSIAPQTYPPNGQPDMNGLTANPYASNPYGAPGATGQFDVMGAILRRKFVVILLGLIGAGLGYLYYTKTAPMYRTGLNLQITTQAPPSIVEGESIFRKSNGTKHQSLITSHIVVKAAVERFLKEKKASGNSSSNSLIIDELSGPGDLKEAISVKLLDKSEETLSLTIQGPDPDELSLLLNNVVEAYTEILTEDNKAVGEESIELIEKLLKQVMTEKKDAEDRYLTLIKSLGIDPSSDSQGVDNPYAVQLAQLTSEEKLQGEALRTTKDKLAMAKTAIDSNDDVQLKVLALEAKQHLKLDYEGRSTELTEYKKNENLMADLRVLDNRIYEMNEKVNTLMFARKENSVLGAGHSKVKSLDSQINFYRDELTRLNGEREQMAKLAEPEEEVNPAQKIDWDEVRRQTEQQWINLYVTALTRDEQRLTSYIEQIDADLKATRTEATRIAGDVVELKILQKQIDEKGEAARATLDRLSEINILSSSYNQTKVRVIDPPGTGYRYEPNLAKSLMIGILLACLVGAGLALLIDRADFVFRSPHEILQMVGSPVLGRVPRINVPKGKETPQSKLITSHKGNSPFVEAFRAARTALFFISQEENIKTLLFTSPSPGDGKSTSVANLAISMAQAGKRVLLIDADFRRPRVDTYFGIKSHPGCMDYLNKTNTLAEVIRPSHQPNLFLMTSGGRPKNPGEVVAGEDFLNLIDELRPQFDFVLIDSPPVLPVADPTTIAAHVDAVVMVLRIRKGVKVTAQRSKESLERVGARIIGILVNGIDENPYYNEYGYYSNAYYSGYSSRHYDKKYSDYQDKISTESPST